MMIRYYGIWYSGVDCDSSGEHAGEEEVVEVEMDGRVMKVAVARFLWAEEWINMFYKFHKLNFFPIN